MLTITSLDSRPGLTVHDRIEDVRFEVHTDRRVSAREVDTDRFRVPVSVAATIHPARLEIPKRAGCCVRRRDGTDVAQVTSRLRERFPSGSYELELTSLPLKFYCHVEGPFEIEPTDGGTRLDFESPSPVTLGLRSFHDQPAATVTTTEDPFDVMQAVSTFGSALKTTSPERSWPTLRGHPPLVEQGSELSVPDALSPPAEDVRIEVPPTLDHVFRVAPLAYYLGAPVRAGGTPTVVAGGTELPLTPPGTDLEDGIHRFLAKSFFLDCLTRTEGLYDLALHERTELEDDLPFDLATVYDLPLAARLRRYAEVPYVLVESALPEWPLCADVRPEPANVAYLPFAANRLAHVRIADGVRTTQTEAEPAQLGTFFRGEQRGIAREATDADVETDTAIADWEDIEFFDPPESDATTHAWVGDGYPLGTAKADVDAMRRRLERTTDEPEAITIRIVCNDAEMAEETAGDLYGLRDLVDFDISVDHDLTVEELRDRLARETDFLHYIGHIDEDGVVCADGSLDLRTLETTGVRAFLLNACHSYRQGEALVDAGADGGIVTLSRVYNEQATKMGQLTARLLNQGFPLDATMDVLEYGPLSSHRYAAVGEHQLQLCQSSSTSCTLIRVESANEQLNCHLREYSAVGRGVGSVSQSHLDDSKPWYLTGATINWTTTSHELVEEIDSNSVPILVNDTIYWGLAETNPF